ncbi:hypothetical protein LCGC14_0432670 [marine sediment metagenome]|uniref:Uncharacterized protein n=1 Tax=marine sediment metagenome TaxID=412755 RepID=A0A0F9T5M3_9ZZZZ
MYDYDIEKELKSITINYRRDIGLSDLEYDDEKYDDEPQATSNYYEEEKMIDDQERARDMNSA